MPRRPPENRAGFRVADVRVRARQRSAALGGAAARDDPAADRVVATERVVVAVRPVAVLVGVGLGMFQVPNLTQIMAAFPARQQGAAGGFAFLSRTIGVVVGVQCAAWLFGARAQVLGFLPAFRFTFDAAAIACGAAALLSLLPGRLSGARATNLEA